jgi:hypothetical protein
MEVNPLYTANFVMVMFHAYFCKPWTIDVKEPTQWVAVGGSVDHPLTVTSLHAIICTQVGGDDDGRDDPAYTLLSEKVY